MIETEPKVVEATARRSRKFVIAEWIVVVGLAMYLGGKTLPDAWRMLNTDFPNYYLTARLAQEKFDTTRVYEWLWIQRQKDHRNIDQRVVGLVPITPFSTIVVRPLASLSPLTAKRCWLMINLCLLAWIAVLLRSIMQMAWRRIALAIVLNFPLHRNLLYGQYYVLLLFVLVLACWFYLRQHRFTAGALIGLGFGLKIFPVLYLLYFLRKRDNRSFVGGIAGCAAVAVSSIGVFGWELNRIYLFQVMPWALRGEGLDPYNLTTSSFAALLHRLFLYEPQWNPHPVWHAPWLFAVLHPLLQVLIVAPVLLLSSSSRTSSGQIRLEWAAMLLAILTISTMPGSYVFTLLILPVCLLWEELQTQRRPWATRTLLVLYLAAGFPLWKHSQNFGWHSLLGVPRLYALIGLCAIGCYLLWQPVRTSKWFGRDEAMWSWAIGCTFLVAVAVGLHHSHGLYADYSARLAIPPNALMVTHPAVEGDSLSFVAMLRNGYQVGEEEEDTIAFSGSDIDQLGVAVAGNKRWIETVGEQSSIISAPSGQVEVAQAESPVILADGSRLAFLREDHGRAQLWMHKMGETKVNDKPITPTGVNVFEMSFLGGDRIVFAADAEGNGPKLYTVDMSGNMHGLSQERARYPTVSPDGKWLAYSVLERGNWNLWIQELQGGRRTRITDSECNSVEPAWDKDSKTLIYASDCGRALWFTALCRRRVVP
jgi:hypothetical protein